MQSETISPTSAKDKSLRCDICQKRTALYDGKTIAGPWAYMCQVCYDTFGTRMKPTKLNQEDI